MAVEKSNTSQQSPNGVDYIEGAAYITGLSCTNIDRFTNWLSPELENIPFSKENVVERIDELMEKYNVQNVRTVNREYATWFCVLKDLERIKSALESGAEVENPLENIEHVYTEMGHAIMDEFPEFELPELKIVENFPPPYDKMNWYACAPDREDCEE